MAMDHVVVVGASLAGMRAAKELRTCGFEGTVTMIGDEPHRPYDRPPLSKQVLSGKWEPERATLPDGDLDVEWRLGAPATGLDLGSRTIALAGGDRVAFDGLVITTGATPRRLPGTEHLAGIHTLRTLDDCLAIKAAIDAGARKVVVVGAGFIGGEVAATCRNAGLEVVLVEALPAPLDRVLGAELGGFVTDLHRSHGVDVRLGVGVVGVEGDAAVERVRLTDGVVDDVDLCVVGIGVAPNTAWLDGSGLDVDDGVVCDETCRAAPGIVAAGDVARWPNRRFDVFSRVEHWDNAAAMGPHAARTLLAGDGAAEAYEPIPWFWSDQYDRKIQLAGSARRDDDIEIVDGSLADHRFTALFGRSGRLVGVLGVNMPANVVRWRAEVDNATGWEAALASAKSE